MSREGEEPRRQAFNKMRLPASERLYGTDHLSILLLESSAVFCDQSDEHNSVMTTFIFT